MKELYDKINNKGVATKPIVYKEGYLGKIGGYLKENEVIQTLIRYCLCDPKCDKYQLGKKKRLDLVKTTSTANDMLFLLVREYMWLFYPTTRINESDNTMMILKIHGYWMCQMWLGEMCDPEYGCETCKNGIKGKNVQQKMTPHMNYGLFTCEDIKK